MISEALFILCVSLHDVYTQCCILVDTDTRTCGTHVHTLGVCVFNEGAPQQFSTRDNFVPYPHPGGHWAMFGDKFVLSQVMLLASSG